MNPYCIRANGGALNTNDDIQKVRDVLVVGGCTCTSNPRCSRALVIPMLGQKELVVC